MSTCSFLEPVSSGGTYSTDQLAGALARSLLSSGRLAKRGWAIKRGHVPCCDGSRASYPLEICLWIVQYLRSVGLGALESAASRDVVTWWGQNLRKEKRARFGAV